MLLGVDVGGTFTDAVLVGEDSAVHTAKVPSTPAEQSVGVLDAVRLGARAGRRRGRSGRALRPRHDRRHQRPARGPHRAHRPDRHGRLHRRDRARPPGARRPVRPVPLRHRPRSCRAELRFAAPERTGTRRARGARSIPPARARSWQRSPAPSRRRSRCRCFTPTPTPRTSGCSARCSTSCCPTCHVSLSCELVGTFREYERTATTVLDAALSPLLGAYLRRLSADADAARPARAADHAVLGRPHRLRARRRPRGAHRPLGPRRRRRRSAAAGGAGGRAERALLRHGRHLLRRLPDRRLRRSPRPPNGRSPDGRCRCRRSTSTPSAPAAARSPGATPGAPCAWDRPRRARVPGPACYGRGGARADGHRRQPAARPPARGLAARRRARRSTAPPPTAPSPRLARELDMDALACAEGIVRVAEAEMLGALRLMTVERGIDPRGFALMPFGGAGPLHAAALARRARHRAHPLPARLRRAVRARPRRRGAPPRRLAHGHARGGLAHPRAPRQRARRAHRRGPRRARRRSRARARAPRAALPRPVLRAARRGARRRSTRTSCARPSPARTSCATATATTRPRSSWSTSAYRCGGHRPRCAARRRARPRRTPRDAARSSSTARRWTPPSTAASCRPERASPGRPCARSRSPRCSSPRAGPARSTRTARSTCTAPGAERTE